MNQVYVLIGGEQTGPFEVSEIEAKLKANDVAYSDLCWSEGMAEWSAISEVFERPQDVPPPPPPPATSLPVEKADSNTKTTDVSLMLIPSIVFYSVYALLKVFVLFILIKEKEFVSGPFLNAFLYMSIVALVLWGTMHYRCWCSLPQKYRATTPVKAIGFLLIPFFNFYWAFISFPKLVDGFQQWQQDRGITPAPDMRHISMAFTITFVAGLLSTYLGYLGIIALVMEATLFGMYYVRVVRMAKELQEFS